MSQKNGKSVAEVFGVNQNSEQRSGKSIAEIVEELKALNKTLMEQDLLDYYRSLLEAKKAELQARAAEAMAKVEQLKRMKQSTEEESEEGTNPGPDVKVLAMPQLVKALLDPNILNAIKQADEETLAKVGILLSAMVNPTTKIDPTLLLLMTVLRQNQGQSSGQADVWRVVLDTQHKMFETLLKLYERMHSEGGGGEGGGKGVWSAVIDAFGRIWDKYSELVEKVNEARSRAEIEALKTKLEEFAKKLDEVANKSNPVDIIKSFRAIAEELGYTKAAPARESVYIEKLRTDLEKERMRVKAEVAKELAKLRKIFKKWEREDRRFENILKYVVLPLLSTLRPTLQHTMHSLGAQTQQMIQQSARSSEQRQFTVHGQLLRGYRAVCPSCNRVIFIPMNPDGTLPREVQCPFCRRTYVVTVETQNQSSTQSSGGSVGESAEAKVGSEGQSEG